MNSILLVEITKRYDNSDVFVPESDGIGPQQLSPLLPSIILPAT